jgi:protease-4
MLKNILHLIASVYRGFRSIVLNSLFIFLVILPLTLLFFSDGEPRFSITPDSTIVLNLQGSLVEENNFKSPLDTILAEANNQAAPNQIILSDLQELINRAAEDQRITSMVLQLDGFTGGGLSQLRELAYSLSFFRGQGKNITAIGNQFSQAQYYLASTADKIVLSKMGVVEVLGLSTWQPYFGSALEKLGVTVNVFRVGRYKSAVEPYQLNSMSDDARQNYSTLLGDLWQIYVDDVTERRSILPGDLQTYADNFDQLLIAAGGNLAQVALNAGLVDELTNKPILYSLNNHFQDKNLVNYQDYQRFGMLPRIPTGEKIGLIIASGEIQDGNSSQGIIGGQTLAAQIQQVTEDETIKALVLRIDSPGGSVNASEQIRSALETYKFTGRPLVVSMSSVAASGGYWIATPADKIITNSATITGSIGIFGLIPTFEGSAEKLGISVDGLGTSELADFAVTGRALTKKTERIIQSNIEYGYQQFLQLVSDSRNLEISAVDTIAQGQVWSGQRAVTMQLADETGNLARAAEVAANLGNIESYYLFPVRPKITALQTLIMELEKNLHLGEGLSRFLEIISNLLALNGYDTFATEEINHSLQELTTFLPSQLHILPSGDSLGAYVYCISCRQLGYTE